jgi:hypothetical protein
MDSVIVDQILAGDPVSGAVSWAFLLPALGRERGSGEGHPPGRPGRGDLQHPDLTIAALRRRFTASDGCQLRVLVRDNASSDGTADAVKVHFPEVEVDAGSENLGFAAGVNTLLPRSTGPWCLA